MSIFCKFMEFGKFNLLLRFSSAVEDSVCICFLEYLGVLRKVQLILSWGVGIPAGKLQKKRGEEGTLLHRKILRSSRCKIRGSEYSLYCSIWIHVQFISSHYMYVVGQVVEFTHLMLFLFFYENTIICMQYMQPFYSGTKY